MTVTMRRVSRSLTPRWLPSTSNALISTANGTIPSPRGGRTDDAIFQAQTLSELLPAVRTSLRDRYRPGESAGREGTGRSSVTDPRGGKTDGSQADGSDRAAHYAGRHGRWRGQRRTASGPQEGGGRSHESSLERMRIGSSRQQERRNGRPLEKHDAGAKSRWLSPILGVDHSSRRARTNAGCAGARGSLGPGTKCLTHYQ